MPAVGGSFYIGDPIPPEDPRWLPPLPQLDQLGNRTWGKPLEHVQIPVPALTEADVRRIVCEEIVAALNERDLRQQIERLAQIERANAKR